MDALSSIQPEQTLLEKNIREKFKEICKKTNRIKIPIVKKICKAVESNRQEKSQETTWVLSQKFNFYCLFTKENIFILFEGTDYKLGEGVKSKVYFCYDYIRNKERAYQIHWAKHSLEEIKSSDIKTHFQNQIKIFKTISNPVDSKTKLLKIVFHTVRVNLISNDDSSSEDSEAKEYLQSMDLTVFKHYRFGDLEKSLKEKRFSFIEKMKIAYDIISNMNLFHQANVIHNDIAEKNILIDYKKKNPQKHLGKNSHQALIAVLGDIGLIAKVKNDQEYTYGGTPLYYSPEKLESLRPNSSSGQMKGIEGKRSDVWAMGLVLYHLFFESTCPILKLITKEAFKEPQKLAKRIKANMRELFPNPSHEVTQLIWQMLHPESDQRITSEKAFKRIEMLYNKTLIPPLTIPISYTTLADDGLDSSDTVSTATASPQTNVENTFSDWKTA